MRSFTKIIALLLATLMLLGLVACATPENTESSQQSAESENGTAETAPTPTESDTSAAPQSPSETESESDAESLSESDTESLSESDSATETETETSRAVGIVENEGYADVYTNLGLSYTVIGYKSVKNGRFIFDKGLEITFEKECFLGEFNRFVFNYKSSEPIQVFVTYELNGEEKTDYFFLEATKTRFRGLIEGYLANKKGVKLKKLTVDTCEEIEGSFFLDDLKTETIPLYADDLCVENDRYKIGVRLSWGGAMTYFEDKMDGDDELGNLVNIHDTGRLIQQSFYGTYSNGEYVAVPNGGDGASLWPYNPVQGGDRGNNGSDRLIDVEYDEEKDYIYIISQSLDWAYVKGREYENSIGYNGLTYTYYENTYSIMEGDDEGPGDDYVVVDNVMTDFSGWTHPAGGQEIPAVYLVSYFDTLSFYNGIKPWTYDDDGIFYEAELGGWSEAKIIPLYKGNTETWSIWVNTDDNFGFGTYCPNIQKHIAIRHQYDGSKNPMANSTSYVAPSCSIVMQSYVPVEYSYILATGTPEKIRRVFTENKDFTDNASLSENRYDCLIAYGKYDMFNMDFTVSENCEIVHSVRHMNSQYDALEGALKLTVEIASDPQFVVDFDWNSDRTVNSSEFNTVEIVYMLPNTNERASDSLVIFLTAGSVTSYNEKCMVSGGIIRDGQYHTLYIKVPEAKCSGDLHKIRIDPFQTGAVGDSIYIKSIRFINTLEAEVENDLSVKGSEQIFSSVAHSNIVFDETEGAVKLSPASPSADVNVILGMSALNLSCEEYAYFVVEYMVPTTNSNSKYSATLYFETETNKGYNEKKAVSGLLTVDGEYHTLVLRMSDNENWTGEINNLRFDYFQNSTKVTDVLYIKSISLVAESGYDILFTDEGSETAVSDASNSIVEFDPDEGALCLEVSGGKDVYFVLDLSKYQLSTEEYTTLYIRYRIPNENSIDRYSSAVYFTTDKATSYSENRAVYSSLVTDGTYHTLVVDLSQNSDWTGNIAKIRFDYFQGECNEGDIIYIEYISLKK